MYEADSQNTEDKNTSTGLHKGAPESHNEPKNMKEAPVNPGLAKA